MTDNLPAVAPDHTPPEVRAALPPNCVIVHVDLQSASYLSTWRPDRMHIRLQNVRTHAEATMDFTAGGDIEPTAAWMRRWLVMCDEVPAGIESSLFEIPPKETWLR